MKKLITAILILLTSIRLDAQTQLLPDGLTVEKYTNEFLDTLNVKKNLVINDYSMFGVTYGVNLSRVTWNPRQNQDLLLIPIPDTATQSTTRLSASNTITIRVRFSHG